MVISTYRKIKDATKGARDTSKSGRGRGRSFSLRAGSGGGIMNKLEQKKHLAILTEELKKLSTMKKSVRGRHPQSRGIYTKLQ